MTSHRTGARAVALLAAAAATLAGASALACPVCAGRADPPAILLAVYGAMVLSPFVAVAVVFRLFASWNAAEFAGASELRGAALGPRPAARRAQ